MKLLDIILILSAIVILGYITATGQWINMWQWFTHKASILFG